MPGGALEVGETPSEGIVREILEETGYHCKVDKLVGVYDSRVVSLDSSLHIYLITFLCSLDNDIDQIDSLYSDEIIRVDWFNKDELPNPIHGGHKDRIVAAFRCWKTDVPAHFD